MQALKERNTLKQKLEKTRKMEEDLIEKMRDSQELKPNERQKKETKDNKEEKERIKLDSFLLESFCFHQSLFNDLRDREWDECDLDMLTKKMNIIFELCYGPNYIENTKLDKKTNKIRRTFLDVSKKENDIYKFNFSFTFNELKNGYTWKSFLLWTISKKDNKKLLIDESCREYKSFDDFIANNCYPKCFMTFPTDGLYKGDNVVNLKCDWSKACDPVRVWRKAGDVVSVIGSIGAAAVLLLNPVGIPLAIAGAGFASTSIYSIARGAENLVDQSKHGGGLSVKNANTWVNGVDVALSTLGLISFGATRVIGAIAKTVAEGSNVYKCAKVARGVCQVFAASGALSNLIVFTQKFKYGEIVEKDYDALEKYFLIRFNFSVCRELMKKLVCDLADRFDNFRSSCFKNMKRGYKTVRKAIKFTLEIQYRELLETFVHPFLSIELSNEELDFKNNVSSAISLSNQFFAGKIHPAKFILLMSGSMFDLYMQATAIWQNRLCKTCNLFRPENMIKLWKLINSNRNNKQCIALNKKMEMIENIESSIVENELITNNSEEDESDVLGCITSIIAQYDVHDEFEVLQILHYYFEILSHTLKAVTESLVCDAYKENAHLVYHKKKDSVPKETNEKEILKMAIQKVLTEVQKSTYHNNFLKHTESLSEGTRREADVTKFVYLFYNWRVTGEVSKDVQYEIVRTIAELHADPTNSEFISNSDKLAVIKMKKNNSLILIFKEVVDSDLRGILLYIPTY